MKVFAVLSVARQIDGEYVVIKAEKAFKQASEADEYMKQNARTYNESVHTPSGTIACLCERGVFELDVQD